MYHKREKCLSWPTHFIFVTSVKRNAEMHIAVTWTTWHDVPVCNAQNPEDGLGGLERRSRTLLSYSEATDFMDKPNGICMNFETTAQKFYIRLGCDFSNVGLNLKEIDIFLHLKNAHGLFKLMCFFFLTFRMTDLSTGFNLRPWRAKY